MADLILYTNPMSRGRIARWMMEEVGEPYDVVLLDYGTSMKDAGYLALNPMGKVPTLRHGDAIVTEGAAICAYLADAFPEKRLAPHPGDPRRGTYFRWLFFAAGPVEQAVTAKAMDMLPPADRARAVGFGTYEDMLHGLEIAVGNSPYLCGDQFSAADVYVGAQIGWGLQFGTIEKRPALVDYAGRMASRPAAERARQLDDADMARVQPHPAQPVQPQAR